MNATTDDGRLLPVGSTIQRRVRDYQIAFDRVRIEPGPYYINHDLLTIAVTDMPLYGYARVNSKPPVTAVGPEASYTLLRPGDHINGLTEHVVDFEVLLICQKFIERPDAATFVRGQEFDGPQIRRPLSPLLANAWSSLRQLIDSGHAVDGIIDLILAIIVFETRQQPADEQQKRSAALDAALAFIDNNLGEPIDVKSVAAAANLSEFYFNRLFREFCQTSVYQFLLERRLDRARQLLASGEQPISAIAQECGFSSQSHLTHTFGQKYGVTPAQYRTRSQNRAGADK
jgi:AraC-like DNA-binding protein